MHLLYLSHCSPFPPDKGERIRAYHEARCLAAKHALHVVCFARNQEEARAGDGLVGMLSRNGGSIHVIPHHRAPALGLGAMRFFLGGSGTAAVYSNGLMRRCVTDLVRRFPIAASVVFSSVMAPYAPDEIPLLFDMVDVDSEKWMQYATMRTPGFLYRWEGKRLRRIEITHARRAVCTFLTTDQERLLFERVSGGVPAQAMENGVDFDFFDPETVSIPEPLQGRQILCFVGAMDYYPNADAAKWFVEAVFPQVRQAHPAAEVFIVGRDPGRDVLALAAVPGVTVTGAVADVRGYVAAAHAAVVPLRLARGIQNKVLEALAMGKKVLATPSVCQTFGASLPQGVFACQDETSMARQAVAALQGALQIDGSIRESARARFSWEANLRPLTAHLEQIDALQTRV